MRAHAMFLGLSCLTAACTATAALIDSGAARPPSCAIVAGAPVVDSVLDIREMRRVEFRVLLHRLSLPVPIADGRRR